MHPMVFIQSAAKGVLTINGQFCGPLDGEGQVFPAGRNAEIYIQFFPFGQALPLTVQMWLRGGEIERLCPQDSAFALVWPGGVIQLELRAGEQEEAPAAQQQAADGVLLRYLCMRLAGEAQAERLMMRSQDAPDLTPYEAAVPLRFAPVNADPRHDERAGLLRRLAPNIAAVDAALAVCVPVGPGMRRIERIRIVRT